MIFHLGCELPEPVDTRLDHLSDVLTPEEVRILKSQIRKNSIVVDEYVAKLDLFVNKERYPKRAIFIAKIRRRLELLMEENDTFRKVLWRHYLRVDLHTKLRQP